LTSTAVFFGTTVHPESLQQGNGQSFWGMATERPTRSYTTWREDVHSKHQKIHRNRAEQVCSHRPCHLSQPRHRLGLHQCDRQRKQQNGPMDQGSDTHQERTRQVDEPRRGVLSTSTHLWLLIVCCSDTWWTVVPKKVATVAETIKE